MNILKQPAYQEINARQIGALPVADRILKDAFFVGVFPGLTEPHLDYMIETFGRFFSKY